MAARARPGWVGRPCAVEIARRADQQEPHRAQPPRQQRGILEAGDAQREVEALGDQIDLPVAEREIERDLGIGRAGTPAASRRDSAMPNDSGALIRTRPRGSLPTAPTASSSTASPSRRMRVARSSDARPASVSDSRREVRAISAKPSRASSRAIALETVGLDRPSSRAARGEGAELGDLGEDRPGFEIGKRRCHFRKR